ncbi:kinase-like protein [Rhizophagus irregularis]|uniref:Kinase-like protein n=1 Tax=Rhizophagus irregularis TaxID=588596 RepID=A0A2N0NSH8_9GLOM|nr:kinase-like protein [Rhizophagus irregularis]PKC57726.1 kinase-like protein [Rhizophagus irregularis]
MYPPFIVPPPHIVPPGNSEEDIIKEIHLTGLVNLHPNIIQFYGVTKLKDEVNYSLVLEYAEDGTLRKYLRDNAIGFEWKDQLRFAKEIASAISWFHDDAGIIHGDLHPNNILISKGTIKLATRSYCITEKSDVYSLGVLFWELTSRGSPFNFDTKLRDEIPSVIINILNGVREKPIPDTNAKFVKLYEKCWKHEPNDRPDIHQVNLELDAIDNNTSTVSDFKGDECLISLDNKTPQIFENNNVSTTFYSEESKYLISSDNKIPQIFEYDNPQKLSNFEAVGSGHFASVHSVKWRRTTTKYALKIFRKSYMSDIINEIYLMKTVDCHPNIIRIYGVTKLEGETNYSLLLEYADRGTLGKYLKDNATTFKDQMKFANEMTSAILCLHENEIIHGDLHPGNILIHQHTIKIADFGRSRKHGSAINKKEKAYGVVPYMDPKILEKILKDHSCDLTKKSDIYSLAVIFWQLTSCRPPFESETDDGLNIRIINGEREIPMPNTDSGYVKLYQRCWKFEPDDRPDIFEIVSILNNIISEKNNATISSEASEITKELENDNQSCQITVRNY